MYLFLYTITVISSFFSFLSGKERIVYRFFLTVCVFSISLSLLLKYGVIDYFSYQRIYNGIDAWDKWDGVTYLVDSNTPIEPGFTLLIYIEKYLFGSFYLFIGVFSLIIFLIKFYVIKKLSPYLAISLFLYVCDLSFFNDLERVRSGMAASLVLLSLYFIYKNRIFLGFSSALLAVSFHYIALLAFIFFIYRRFNSHLLLVFTFCTSLLIAIYGGIGKDVSIVISQILALETDSRLTSHMEGRHGAAGSLFSGTYIYLILVALLSLAKYRALIKAVPCNNIYLPVYILSLSFSLILIDYGIISSRIWHVYCLPSLLIIIPSMLKLFRGRDGKLLIFSIIIFFYSFLFYLYSSQRESYIFIFNAA